MDLRELCSRAGATPPRPSVPRWTWGCFRRRSISFFNGQSDVATLVLWLQSRGLTGDLRIAADRPQLATREALASLPFQDLVRLAEVEGGMSPTRFEADVMAGHELSGTMTWPDWTAFQGHAKWPEPGQLRRVGDCLIEYAPSGAYVEDWRLQLSGEGPLLGLSLVEERADDGRLLHRGGGLVIAGEHAMLVRGRAERLPSAARVTDLLERAAREPQLLDAIFGCEASYARRDASGHYVIEHSTLPWREGKSLLTMDGFALNEDGTVTHRSLEDDRVSTRRFVVDTLEPSYSGCLATEASESALSWLHAEDTLLRAARKL